MIPSGYHLLFSMDKKHTLPYWSDSASQNATWIMIYVMGSIPGRHIPQFLIPENSAWFSFLKHVWTFKLMFWTLQGQNYVLNGSKVQITEKRMADPWGIEPPNCWSLDKNANHLASETGTSPRKIYLMTLILCQGTSEWMAISVWTSHYEMFACHILGSTINLFDPSNILQTIWTLGFPHVQLQQQVQKPSQQEPSP